jgi:hypothetical protein
MVSVMLRVAAEILTSIKHPFELAPAMEGKGESWWYSLPQAPPFSRPSHVLDHAHIFYLSERL